MGAAGWPSAAWLTLHHEAPGGRALDLFDAGLEADGTAKAEVIDVGLEVAGDQAVVGKSG